MKTLYYIISILLIIIMVSYTVVIDENNKLKEENSRLAKNVNAYRNGYQSYKTAYGRSAIKVQALTLTVQELKENESGLQSTIKELKKKPKQVQSVTLANTETQIKFVSEIQYVDTTKCFNYQDNFNTVNGCFDNDSVKVEIEVRDSLTAIATRIPKHRFLWWSWGVKAIELDLISQNPKTKFTYLKYIELK